MTKKKDINEPDFNFSFKKNKSSKKLKNKFYCILGSFLFITASSFICSIYQDDIKQNYMSNYYQEKNTEVYEQLKLLYSVLYYETKEEFSSDKDIQKFQALVRKSDIDSSYFSKDLTIKSWPSSVKSKKILSDSSEKIVFRVLKQYQKNDSEPTRYYFKNIDYTIIMKDNKIISISPGYPMALNQP